MNESIRNATDEVYDAIIIGAGHNGLVCAYYLASRGLKVVMLERRHLVGGAAVTEEFHPGFRNSTVSYTVGLLQPKMINDMRLYEHRVVLRKVDNFLPTLGPDCLLARRGGLTRREIARRSAADVDRNEAYSAVLATSSGSFASGCFQFPRTPGAACPGRHLPQAHGPRQVLLHPADAG